MVMVYKSLYILLNSIYQYFLKNFCLYINEEDWSVFFFFVFLWSSFNVKVTIVLRSKMENVHCILEDIL